MTKRSYALEKIFPVFAKLSQQYDKAKESQAKLLAEIEAINQSIKLTCSGVSQYNQLLKIFDQKTMECEIKRGPLEKNKIQKIMKIYSRNDLVLKSH